MSRTNKNFKTNKRSPNLKKFKSTTPDTENHDKNGKTKKGLQLYTQSTKLDMVTNIGIRKT